MKKFNVIVPVYNEVDRIARTCDCIKEFLEVHDDYKFTFVDDGSSDRTLGALEENIGTVENIEVLPLGKNCGKGAAVRYGILNSDSEYVCFIDGDMAYSFNHLVVMFRELQEKSLDVVIGSRALGFKNIKRVAFLRRILGGGFNFLVRMLTGLPYKDTQAGLKGFRTKYAKEIFERIHDSRFWFDVEVLFIAKKFGLKIGEIPAIVAKDHTLKNTRVRLFSDTIKMFMGLVKINIYNIRGDYRRG